VRHALSGDGRDGEAATKRCVDDRLGLSPCRKNVLVLKVRGLLKARLLADVFGGRVFNSWDRAHLPMNMNDGSRFGKRRLA
jgi:hypothetical protein